MSDSVTCDIHGDDLPAAYVCRHLHEGSGTGWNDAGTDELCPDAWCDACERIRAANDGWEGADVEIRLLCACCYHKVRGRGADPGDAPWDARVATAVASVQARNDALEAAHGLFGRGSWHYDADPLVIEFREDGRLLATCNALALGSYSEESGSFLWGWANRSQAAVDRAPVAFVAGVGERAGLAALTEPYVRCELVEAWERAAVAAHLLGAVGLYRCPSDHLHLFLGLMDVWVDGEDGFERR